jgi:hypothetical protein
MLVPRLRLAEARCYALGRSGLEPELDGEGPDDAIAEIDASAAAADAVVVLDESVISTSERAPMLTFLVV